MRTRTDPNAPNAFTDAPTRPKDTLSDSPRRTPDLHVDVDEGDRYEAVAPLGAGGMGDVVLCRDRRIGRDIAMKKMRAEHHGRGDLRQRFLREARVQGQLEHPAIVPVYDLGCDPAGGEFFTMKRVRGQTFDEIIDRLGAGEPTALAQYTRRKLLTAFASVCLAVHFAHARGVLHRDLKPSNVMLGDFGEVYVLDWGLAKVKGEVVAMAARRAQSLAADDPVVAEASDPDPEWSIVGEAMGTPGYMPPEQIRGDVMALDARTDVYALGAMLFEILALEPLFARGPSTKMLAEAMKGAEARFSIRCPKMDIPPELEAICHKATALDPDQRFQSAREMSDAIERYLDGDRDVERRRELAAVHAREAARHAQAARGEGEAGVVARQHAMREVARALALDPENRDAARTLVQLFVEPPREVPPEAMAEVHAARRRSIRAMAGVGAAAYMSVLLFVPITATMGPHVLWPSIVFPVCWILAAVVAYLAMRRPSETARISYPFLAVSNVAVAMACTLFGPYILAPSVAAMNASLFSFSPDRSRRWAILVFSCLAIMVPAALDWAGVIGPFYTFEDGTMRVHPQHLNFPATSTQIFLAATSVAVIALTCFMTWRFRDTLSKAEERLQLQAWQLRQLVPPEARAVAASSPHLPSELPFRA